MAKEKGYKQWKSSLSGIEENERMIKEALDRMLSASTPGEKAVAISLALNVEHYTGQMGEHLGLSKSDLVNLSNIDVTPWDNELKEEGLKLARKMNQMLKTAGKKWDQNSVKDFLKENSAIFESNHFSINIIGSLSGKEESEHDLDLLLIPTNEAHDAEAILEAFEKLGCKIEYGSWENEKEPDTLHFPDGRIIDLFYSEEGLS